MKDLKYYLSLDYEIFVEDLSEDGERCFRAYTKELNINAFYGSGETEDEAKKDFIEVKNELMEYYFDNNIEIIEPTIEKYRCTGCGYEGVYQNIDDTCPEMCGVCESSVMSLGKERI